MHPAPVSASSRAPRQLVVWLASSSPTPATCSCSFLIHWDQIKTRTPKSAPQLLAVLQRLVTHAEEVAFNDPPAGMAEQMILNQHLYRLLRHSRLTAFQQFVQQVGQGEGVVGAWH